MTVLRRMAARATLAPALLVLAAGCVTELVGGPDPRPPNILLVVADDLGWNDVGYHGARIHTPHLDRLARTGVVLDQHYVQPVCTPTRAALLTGRYPSRFGPHVRVPSNRRALPPGTETLASALRDAGYRTALAGKWHLGSRPEWGPAHYGFERSYGCLTGAADPWTHGYREGAYAHTWHRDHRPLEEQGNATELIAAQVVRWIESFDEPWLVYVPFTAVHIPIDAPALYRAPYAAVRFFDDPVQDESFRRYASFVSQLDAKVGEFLRALDRTGQRARTLVVFTSDNGGLPGGGNPYIGDVPPARTAGDNAPLRGQKAQLYEGGIRVPALASWPGRLAPRVVTAPIHAVDWTPTLLRLCGVEPRGEPPWDGEDVWPLLTGDVAEPPPRTLYWPYRGADAIRHGGWKLIERRDGRAELFDLAADPREQRDLSGEHPDRVAALRELLARERRRDVDEVPADLVGVPER